MSPLALQTDQYRETQGREVIKLLMHCREMVGRHYERAYCTRRIHVSHDDDKTDR